jgi:precorrin-6B C5,15-methyltransferase / cobalt-precorrin-6B C5,C15-methyltransferase
MHYIVIGISNNPALILPDEVVSLLPLHTVFSGGKRHYELVRQYLPADHQWIDIKSDMPGLFAHYAQFETVVVFASGDPLFYGFGGTIQKYHPAASLKVYPHFNSLQLLCQRCNIAYQHIYNASVHGRSWDELDTALISGAALIGVPMIVGEALEGVNEKISYVSLPEAGEYDALNCVLLVREHIVHRPFGIADHLFAGLPNRPNMITKMPVRLVSLSRLDLHHRRSLWDIGFCTGAVSIEAKKQFPHLQVTAFEKRPECDELFDINTRRFSTPGITKVMGDIFTVPLTGTADAMFIGGHGNRLSDLLCLLDPFLAVGGRLVINAVKEESKGQFIKGVQQLNYRLLEAVDLTVDAHNPITILTAEKV